MKNIRKIDILVILIIFIFLVSGCIANESKAVNLVKTYPIGNFTVNDFLNQVKKNVEQKQFEKIGDFKWSAKKYEDNKYKVSISLSDSKNSEYDNIVFGVDTQTNDVVGVTDEAKKIINNGIEITPASKIIQYANIDKIEDVKKCNVFSNDYIAELCLSKFAIKEKDIKICIIGDYILPYCEEYFLETTKDEDACYTYKDKDPYLKKLHKNSCLKKIAKIKNDPSICNEIGQENQLDLQECLGNK